MAEQLVIDSFNKIGSGRALYDVKTNQGDFYYFPSEYVTKGVKYNNYIYYDPQLLENDVLKTAKGINLDPSVYEGTLLKDLYENPGSGVLLPKDAYDMNKGPRYYDPKRGAIAGMTTIDGKNVYLLEGYTDRRYEYFTADKNEKGNYTGGGFVTTITPGKSKFGKLGKIARSIGEFVAGVPLLPEIVGVVTGSPQIYAVLKGASLGSQGVSPLKAGIQVGATVAVSNLLKTPDFSKTIGKTVLGEAASDKVATVVGSAVVGGTANAIVAATVGGDVAKSFFTGAVASGVLTGSGEVAEALIGKENVASIAELTGLSNTAVENVIARSLVDGAIASANGQDFAEAAGASLVSGGLSAVAATQVTDALKDKVGKSTLDAIGTATAGIVRTGSDAAISGQDINKALENAAPGIVLSTITTAIDTSKREKKQVKKIVAGNAVLVAGEPTAEILQSLKAQPTAGEEVVREGYDQENDVFVRQVSGVKNDGTRYNYVINVFDSGNVYYTYLDENNDPITVEERPNLTSAPSGVGERTLVISGDIGAEGAPTTDQLPVRGLIDLRTIVTKAAPAGRVAISSTGGTTGSGQSKGTTGFAFIGKDQQGRDRYEIGGINFTVVMVDGKEVLTDDEMIVFLEPTVDPVTNTPELKTTTQSEPFVPPDLEPTDEGKKGEAGEEGVAGGAPSGPSQELLDRLERELQQEREAQAARAEAERIEAERLAIELGRAERTERARTTRAEQERAEFERQQAQFERDLEALEQDLIKAKSDQEKILARSRFATEQRQRLSESRRLTGDLESQIQSELDNLLQEYEDAQARAGRAVTQRETIVAPQQPGDAGREISDAEIMRLLGLSDEEAERFGFRGDVGGVSAGEGPGSAVEGEEPGAVDEGEGLGAADEGAGPGAGEEGAGAGAGEDVLQPRIGGRVVFDTPETPESQPFGSRVTGEALASILGEKEPLFGGDEDEQRAVWNRRSLRLRKALGL